MSNSKSNGTHFKWTIRQFSVIAHRHDEIHAIDADSLPPAFAGAVSDPLPGNVGPDLVFHPGFYLVANPAGFPRKNQGRFAFERQHTYT